MELPTPVLQTDAMETLLNELAEQLDYELKGAYRADYNYVHIFTELPEQGGFEVSAYALPSDHKEPPFHSWEAISYTRTYDLREENLNEKARRELQA